MVIIFAHCIYVAIRKPYSLKSENFRSIGVKACSLLVMAIYIITALQNPSFNGGGLRVYLPYIVLTILLINIILSTYFIALQIKRFIIAHI
jgi:hypothetical protein